MDNAATNQNSKITRGTIAKGGKTCVSRPRMVLVSLILIGWESDWWEFFKPINERKNTDPIKIVPLDRRPICYDYFLVDSVVVNGRSSLLWMDHYFFEGKGMKGVRALQVESKNC